MSTIYVKGGNIMICPKCGRRTYKNETVCPKCGTDMTARRTPKTASAHVAASQGEPYYTPETAAHPVSDVYVPPVYAPIPESAQYTAPKPAAPTPPPAPKQTQPPRQPAAPRPNNAAAPKPAPAPSPAPAPEKEDLDRTLTFAAIRESSSAETAAVREYNRMKAQLRESKSADDASKVVLERLPEGYVYVKMSIDDADRFSKRKNIPKPVVMAVAGAAIITVFLIALLFIITGNGSSTPAVVGRWQGEIEPLRFGITGIPFTTVDTVWEFEENGDMKILPQDSLLAGYDLIGTYKLSADGDSTVISLDLDYYGEKISVDVICNIDKDTNTMIISNRDDPSHTYSFEKLD